MSDEQVSPQQASQSESTRKDLPEPVESPLDRSDEAELREGKDLRKSEGFSLKDKLAIGIASTSLLISVTLFWLNNIHVNHQLEATVASVATYSTGHAVVTIAVLNKGNREAAVIHGSLVVWRDDFELADGWHNGGWSEMYSAMEAGGAMEPFSLKPGEVKIVSLERRFNLDLIRSETWGSRVGAGKKFRSIAYGLRIETLDGDGARHYAEFPAMYNRCSIRGEDKFYTLGTCRAEYAIPVQATPLFTVGVQSPYLKAGKLSFNGTQWDIHDTESQTGVRIVR